MKLNTLHEAKHIGGGKGSLEWMLKNFFEYIGESEANVKEYRTKDDLHIYDRSADRVAGIDTWKTPDGDVDFDIRTYRKNRSGLFSAYTPLDQLIVYKVEQVWGPKD